MCSTDTDTFVSNLKARDLAIERAIGGDRIFGSNTGCAAGPLVRSVLPIALLALVLRLFIAWTLPLDASDVVRECAPDERGHLAIVQFLASGTVPEWPQDTGVELRGVSAGALFRARGHAGAWTALARPGARGPFPSALTRR